MKQFLFSILIFSLLACNNDGQKESGEHRGDHVTDSNGSINSGAYQGAHNTGDFSTPDSGYRAQMLAAMNNMMHHMETMKPTGNADYDFAMMMRHHHMGAMDMAKAELGGGTDTTMKALAQKIYEDQEKEVAQLNQFMQNNPSPSGKSDYGQKAMKMMTPMDESHHQQSSLDVVFATMMIPHHEDGVRMARSYLNESNNAELKKIAQNIIATQPKEVSQMREWLKKNGATDAHKGSAHHSGTAVAN